PTRIEASAEDPSPTARLALALSNRCARVDKATATRLRGPLREWRARVRRFGRARLLFLLREPPAEGPQLWHVEFWVCSPSEPGLRLPLEQVWSGEGAPWLPEDRSEEHTSELQSR